MLGAIFYKEFLKTRLAFACLMAANALFVAWLYAHTRHLFVLDHAEMVWYRVLHLGHVHYGQMRYLPALTGLVAALVQYLPEMQCGRLRLSLHLPVPTHRLILAHVLVGCAAVGCAVALDLAGLALVTGRYFPAEAVHAALSDALPWSIAGFTAYMGATLALLEPDFRTRIRHVALGAGITGLFLASPRPGGYAPALFPLAIVVLCLVPAVLLPAYRFRYRRAG